MPENPAGPLTFYPAFCWPESPTFNIWAKLSAVDVQSLHKRPGYESHGRVWFYQNHPVRYVRLVGLVVAYDEASEWTGLHVLDRRPHIITVDDGSGETLDVVLWKMAYHPPALAEFPGELIKLGPTELKKKVGLSVTGHLVDLKDVELGKIIKVKGWVEEYRGRKQMLLERVSLVRDTAEEVREWEQLADFQKSVLSKPWVLSSEQVKTLRRKEGAAPPAKRIRSALRKWPKKLAPDSFEVNGRSNGVNVDSLARLDSQMKDV